MFKCKYYWCTAPLNTVSRNERSISGINLNLNLTVAVRNLLNSSPCHTQMGRTGVVRSLVRENALRPRLQLILAEISLQRQILLPKSRFIVSQPLVSKNDVCTVPINHSAQSVSSMRCSHLRDEWHPSLHCLRLY